jgi:hypothetical protein
MKHTSVHRVGCSILAVFYFAVFGAAFADTSTPSPVQEFQSPVGDGSTGDGGNMAPNHVTTLDELQCLCANCHRIVHRDLKLMHIKLASYSEEA